MQHVSVLHGRKVTDNPKKDFLSDVLVIPSSSIQSGSCLALLNDDSNFWMSKCERNAHILFRFIKEPVIVSRFVFKFPILNIVSGENPLVPSELTFFGSFDGQKWFKLCSYKCPKDICSRPSEAFECSVDTNAEFICKFIKVTQNGRNLADTDTLALSYLDIQSLTYSVVQKK